MIQIENKVILSYQQSKLCKEYFFSQDLQEFRNLKALLIKKKDNQQKHKTLN